MKTMLKMFFTQTSVTFDLTTGTTVCSVTDTDVWILALLAPVFNS